MPQDGLSCLREMVLSLLGMVNAIFYYFLSALPDFVFVTLPVVLLTWIVMPLISQIAAGFFK
jgi:hypothetical protein